MTIQTNPSTYEAVAGFLTGKFFLAIGERMNWIKDPDSHNLLFVEGENAHLDTLKGVLRPDGGYTAFVRRTDLANEHCTRKILRHLGVAAATPRRGANIETHYELEPTADQPGCTSGMKVRDMNMHLIGEYQGLACTHASSLNLRCIVPEEFVPQYLPKVPRKVIAELRKHVENQFKLAEIADKVAGGRTQRHALFQLKDGHPVRLAMSGDLAARGRLMATTDMEFWRFARAHYTIPGLIDSCRAEFYNACGVRPEPTVEPPPFVPKSTSEF